MAKLIQLNEPGGPGEARTAETLRSELPDEWVVIAGKQLVRPHTSRDIDFLVIGLHRVFVCEEKSYAGTLTGTTSRWILPTGESMKSPHDQVVQVSRMVAGHLEKAVPDLKEALASAPQVANGPPTRAVLHRVILSAPNADPRIEDPRVLVELLMLSDAAPRLMNDDAAGASTFSIAPFRDTIIGTLADLPERSETPSKIGEYTIDEALPPLGTVRQYLARHSDGSPRLLRVFPRLAVIETDASNKEDNVLLREYSALKLLRESGRSPIVDPYFRWDENQFWVVPIHPIQGETLEDLANSITRIDRAHTIEVVAEAFNGLAGLHTAGMLHRGIAPGAVWVRPDGIVTLGDFRLARMPDRETISSELDVMDDPSIPYRAPEVRHSLAAASPASDVFSLTAALVYWLSGGVDVAVADTVAAAMARLPEPLRAILHTALARDPELRPTAAAVAEAARALTGGPITTIEVGVLFDSRYRIIRRLGEGATAVSWLALDEKLKREITLKVIKQGMLDPARLRHEFEVLSNLSHDNVPRVFDLWLDSSPEAMACAFVPGSSIKELGSVLRRDTTRCRSILIDILSGLGYVHAHQVLHRDISPGNVVVPDEVGAPVKLIDFGLASGPDHAGSVVGTPRYRAPEVDTHGEWSVAADLYGAAAVIFEAYAGSLPYRTIEGAVRKTELVDADDESFAGLHHGFLRCLLRAAAPDPADRYPDAAAFVGVLAQLDPDAPDAPAAAPGGREVVNPTVDELRRLYRNSVLGNHGNRGLDTMFAQETYVRTRLDDILTPAIMGGTLALVILSGNPGDGKTSYLERLAADLESTGAVVAHRDEAGWRLERGDHVFCAVFDASESHGGLSADDQLDRILAPLADYPDGVSSYTALIAANDGRILDFFERNRTVYPDLWDELRGQIYGGRTPADVAVVVDLKRRSLVSLDDPDSSLFGRVLDELVASTRWSACEECVARLQCPMRFNALSLAAQGPDAPRQRLHGLLLVSHLRGERRATLRDVRSALGFVITADRSCDEIHAEVRDGLSPLVDDSRLYFTLAVDGSGSPDLLLHEWATLDPATVPNPEVERLLSRARDAGWASAGLMTPVLAARPSLPGGWHESSGGTLTPAKRRFYFEGPTDTLSELGMLGFERLLPYRHLATFREALSSPDVGVLAAVLLGLSRAIGVLGYDRGGLALRSSERDAADGVVVKELPADELQLLTPQSVASYVEAAPDQLRLAHVSGRGLLRIGLDQFELLMRAADGYLPTNQEARPILEELAGFAEELLREPADRVMVVQPNGRLSEVERVGATIALVTA